MEGTVKIFRGSVWRHRKHDPMDADPMNFTYEVTGFMFDAERDVLLVIYTPLYLTSHLLDEGSDGYVRTVENFLERFTPLQ